MAMRMHFRSLTGALALLWAGSSAMAADFHDPGFPVKHVLLISVDGLHAADLTGFVAARPQSALARLADRGTSFSEARTPVPSDSFPGLLALVTGGTPKSTGIVYDDSYDRALSPAGSDCKTFGAEMVLDEAVDVDDTRRDTSLDDAKLPRDPQAGCAVVRPHQLLRVNTIFEVVKAAGGRTVWSDKHPAYDLVNGPSGAGVDDLIVPEINAEGTTDSIPKTIAYDASRADSVIRTILGQTASGAGRLPSPTLFGMNLQAVSVAQKLPGAGYVDAVGTPSTGLMDALEKTDATIGRLVAALDTAGMADTTLIVITAKHGQSPTDPALRRIVDKTLLAKIVKAAAPAGVAHITEDTAAYIWLNAHADVQAVAKAIEAHSVDLGSPTVLSGDALLAYFNDPTKDGRMPDVMLQPTAGVIYAKADATKLAEHGGSLDMDRHVGLLVAGPGIAAHRVVATPVSTTSVAPTIIGALGLEPSRLQAVAAEATTALPSLLP